MNLMSYTNPLRFYGVCPGCRAPMILYSKLTRVQRTDINIEDSDWWHWGCAGRVNLEVSTLDMD